MFQYAAGRRLAHFNDATLKIDLSWYDNIRNVDTPRKYALNKFKIEEKLATELEIRKLTDQQDGWKSFLSCKLGKQKKIASHVLEKNFSFDSKILNLPDNVYLEGHWQSEKYFADIKNIIYKEFVVKTEPTDKNLELAERIPFFEAVSLHIRRGDYYSNPITRDKHGYCSLNYYSRCIEYISSIVNNPHFLIFSDDCQWVKDNMKLTYPMTIVSHNGEEESYEDLRLMSLCKYHIISNSTFSWWGAWLSKKPGKGIVAPKKWFNDISRDTKDIIPNNWVKI